MLTLQKLTTVEVATSTCNHCLVESSTCWPKRTCSFICNKKHDLNRRRADKLALGEKGNNSINQGKERDHFDTTQHNAASLCMFVIVVFVFVSLQYV